MGIKIFIKSLLKMGSVYYLEIYFVDLLFMLIKKLNIQRLVYNLHY